MEQNFKSWPEIVAERPIDELLADLSYEWQLLRDEKVTIDSSPIGLLIDAIKIKQLPAK